MSIYIHILRQHGIYLYTVWKTNKNINEKQGEFLRLAHIYVHLLCGVNFLLRRRCNVCRLFVWRIVISIRILSIRRMEEKKYNNKTTLKEHVKFFFALLCYHFLILPIKYRGMPKTSFMCVLMQGVSDLDML